jgi:putative transposase
LPGSCSEFPVGGRFHSRIVVFTQNPELTPIFSQHYHSSGHVWQVRFRAFPIQEDDHLLTVLRYIERNPVRAGLVARAQDWLWSSAAPPAPGAPPLVAGPVPRPAAWLDHVNQPQTEAEVERLRLSVQRNRHFGEDSWMVDTARCLGLQAGLTHQNPPELLQRA